MYRKRQRPQDLYETRCGENNECMSGPRRRTVRVVKDARVRGLQIDAQSTRPSGENETEDVAPGFIEVVNVRFAVFVVGVAIDATILVPAHHHKVFEDVQNAGHLRENQNSIAALVQAFEEFVHHGQLPAIVYQVLT